MHEDVPPARPERLLYLPCSPRKGERNIDPPIHHRPPTTHYPLHAELRPKTGSKACPLARSGLPRSNKIPTKRSEIRSYNPQQVNHARRRTAPHHYGARAKHMRYTKQARQTPLQLPHRLPSPPKAPWQKMRPESGHLKRLRKPKLSPDCSRADTAPDAWISTTFHGVPEELGGPKHGSSRGWPTSK